MIPQLCRADDPLGWNIAEHPVHSCVMHKTHLSVHVCLCGHVWGERSSKRSTRR